MVLSVFSSLDLECEMDEVDFNDTSGENFDLGATSKFFHPQSNKFESGFFLAEDEQKG